MTCQSRILRTFKKAKADCVAPYAIAYSPPIKVDEIELNGKKVKVDDLEVCGGDVTVVLKAVNEPYYGGTNAELEAEFTCSRCKFVYVPQRKEIEAAVSNGEFDITPYL